jgi:hypothetical protein
MAITIPSKDADFNVLQEVIVAKAVANIVLWGLDEPWMNSVLIPKKNKWSQAWANYLQPASRTPLITFAKNEARKDYEPQLRILIRNLESNTRVTDDDRRAMGIVIPSKNRRPVQPPNSYPGVRMDTSIIRCLILYFFDLLNQSRAKPHGVRGVEIRWAILDIAPTNIEDLIHSDFDTNSPFTLKFEESERGKIVYFCLRWETNTGGKGPWSEIIWAVIP